MREVIIHPGLPRTGTTVLQQHVFPRAERTLLLSKAYGEKSLLYPYTLRDLKRLIGSVEGDAVGIKSSSAIRLRLFRAIYTACFSLAVDNSRVDVQRLLQELLHLVSRGGDQESVVISSERLMDTYSSLNGASRQKGEKVFPVFVLMSNMRAIGIEPRVLICLREPLGYLRSKYLRTLGQRRAIGARLITPYEYIIKQVALEESCPGTSVLSPAQHSRFLKTLQACSAVHAVGFRVLIQSNDVFAQLGFTGQPLHAFRDFPRENQLPYSIEEEEYVRLEVIRALKSTTYYDKIMLSKRFD
ncbi:P-loop containing nucleoside triphosphate hydrolase [Cyanobium sp. NS01]|nr:P-loop containing nucleoside triphosphate hydrolase [Cyanobium sp. NS01]